MPPIPDPRVLAFRRWAAAHAGLGPYLCEAQRVGRFDCAFWRAWEAAQADRILLELVEPASAAVN